MSNWIWSNGAMCPIHGDPEWVDCWNCEEGASHHDCGEDTCVCLDPEPNVRCDVCNGKGGWYLCHGCVPASAEAAHG